MAAAITEAAIGETASPLCRASVEVFAQIIAAECGNVALRFVARGGVYLGGGIPPKILSFLDTDRFRETFVAKSRMTSFLERIPVTIILNPRVGTLGAAHSVTTKVSQ